MNIQCTICMSHFRRCDSTNVTTCGHVFHERCFSLWMLRANTCPQCRSFFESKKQLEVKFITTTDLSDNALSIKKQLADALEELNILNSQIAANRNVFINLKTSERLFKEKVWELRAAYQLQKSWIQHEEYEIERLEKRIDDLDNMEKILKEKSEHLEGLDDIKTIINASNAKVLTLLQTERSSQLEMMVQLKSELITIEETKRFAKSSLDTSINENSKLRVCNRDLLIQIDEIKKDNQQLENYVRICDFI